MTAPAQPFSAASLYVGDLNADVSENILFEIFNAIGPVSSIRVCRDTITRRSLGYAYVNFTNPADAQRALDELNFSNIKGRPCRIMVSQRDPGLRKSGAGNVFVHNLEKSIDNQELYETFKMFGSILSSKVQMKDGFSLGYGFVHFEKDEDAQKAINQVNGMEIKGQMVRVELFKPLAERDGGKKAKFTNLYVKNLPESYTNEQLTELFSRHGEVANVYISVDETNKSKGFGFVNFVEPESALAAVEALHNLEIEAGKNLFVGRAQKKSERERELRERFEKIKRERISKYVAGTNLYIKNLADEVDDEALRADFSKIGAITSCKVMKDRETGRVRGFGFVCFQTPEDATRAVTEMNGKLMHGKPLYVALAQRRDQRRAQLEAQYANQQFVQGAVGMGGMNPMMGPMGFAMGAPPMYYPRGNMMPPQMMAPYAGGAPGGRPGAVGGGAMGGVSGGARGGPFASGYPQMMPQGYMQAPPMRGQGQQQQGGAQGQGSRQGQGARQGGAGVTAAAGKPRAMVTPQGPVATPVDAFSPEVLAAATPEMQKQIIGERLYAQIQLSQPAAAAKITGMLLEMDNTELLNLLESPAALNEKVAEAIRVLNEHTTM